MLKNVDSLTNTPDRTLAKKLANQKGLDYETLGKLVGVSEISIHRYLNGERQPPWDVANRIAEVLGVPAEDYKNLFKYID